MELSQRSKKIGAAAIAAAALAAPMEGLKLTPYYDPPGILTVCMGHTGKDVVKGRVYTLAECDKFMTDDMRKAVTQVDTCVPDAPMGVLIAFSDAAFNLGPRIACDKKNSTAARLLAAGDWVGACNQLPRWDKARVFGILVTLPGLTKRRGLEKEICLSVV